MLVVIQCRLSLFESLDRLCDKQVFMRKLHFAFKGKFMPLTSKLAVLFVIAAGIGFAQANDLPVTNGATTKPVSTDQPIFKFGGFGTLGISHSNMGLGDYVLDSTLPKGPGISNRWSANNDSRIGVQATASFTPKVSAVLQLISEYQFDGNYHPIVEWANVKYAFTPDAYLRIGRIALPTFMNSDSRKVGYSYPWIHPPVELYRALSITNSDGMDASYRFQIGEAGNSVKIIYGKHRDERPASTSLSRNIWGIFDTLEYGPATLRAGYQERESSSHNRLTGVTGAWIRNSDLTLGASYDPGAWFVMSEWIQRKSNTKLDAMYVSAGSRIDKLTPYMAYSQNSPASFLSGLPAPTAASIRSSRRSQDTISLGVRWDFMKNTDFKLQFDRVKLSNDSNGYLVNVPAGVNLYGSKFHVISTVVDFVF